jgi:hypothetical protein
MILANLPLQHAQDPERDCVTVIVIVIRDDCFYGVVGSLCKTSTPAPNSRTMQQDLGLFKWLPGRASRISKSLQDPLYLGITWSKPASETEESPGFVIQTGNLIDCI